ncbi:helix-turn-helix domain-containing protein [Lutispora sp.]|uniref:helix-turn-helix domain-containing protein n=1 Tax=Lutispora sp. TaxID=2828727 RepID=UPI002B21E093|nr:helix-turn-helix domain-containing protein [Lutispora sp.]MEA4960082.1 helix-turn-helix domain-containing protein [Lutispora sp.]
MQDIEKQKSVILALHEKKSAGLVICHVDLFIKEVHQAIIELCDELEFPLIVANSERSYVEILNPIILRLMGNPDSEYNSVINMQNKLIEYIATKRDVNYIYKTMSEEYGSKIFFLDINNKILYPKYDKKLNEIVGLITEYYNSIREECREKGYCIIDANSVKKIILPIQSNGLHYGLIAAEISGNDLDKNIRVLQIMASLCTLIFTKNSRISELETVRKQEYISDLITWNFRSDDVAVKMGHDVGWNILDKCRMLIVNLNDIQESVGIKTKDYEKFINEVLYNKVKVIVKADNDLNLIGLRSDTFIILLQQDNRKTYERSKNLGRNILKCCNESFTGSVSVGISTDIDNYKSIPNAYIEAMDAVRIGRHFLGVNNVVNFEDLGFYGIFKEIRDIKRFSSIKNDFFIELKKYDEETNMDLYVTLRSLIYNNMSTEKVADELYLHRNTINYRKKKIVEILGYEPWSMPYLLNTLIFIVSEYFE